MTEMRTPRSAKVFIVGANQAKHFPVTAVDHNRHLDALFNRNGETCRGLYDELYPRPSKTRPNLDDFENRLAAAGVTAVLQTNVVCYSTRMSADLRQKQHLAGRKMGGRIFEELLKAICPKVVILHGVGTCDAFEKQFNVLVPRPAANEEDGIRSSRVAVNDITFEVIVIPSLAPPAFNRWSAWADRHLDAVSAHVAARLRN
ncbi:hypothetical protein [Caballeronia sp. INML2]|jgi:hypothetical protein|uniref:hypothetical protein n=1 Tax=Caballeronia sp. INML2 TaxID=2921748 RepID=UPI0020290C5D|nr:hypothetical protein [Caballeronia sp. INML2]